MIYGQIIAILWQDRPQQDFAMQKKKVSAPKSKSSRSAKSKGKGQKAAEETTKEKTVGTIIVRAFGKLEWRCDIHPSWAQITKLVIDVLSQYSGVPRELIRPQVSLLDIPPSGLGFDRVRLQALTPDLSSITEQFPGGQRIFFSEMQEIEIVMDVIELAFQKTQGAESDWDMMRPRRFLRDTQHGTHFSPAKKTKAFKPAPAPPPKPAAKKPAKKASKKPAKKTSPKSLPITRRTLPRLRPRSPISLEDHAPLHWDSVKDDERRASLPSEERQPQPPEPRPTETQEPEARFVQADVYPGKRPEGDVPIPKAFLAGVQHGIDVYIGPIEEGKVSLKDENALFPDEHLPKELSDYVIQIDFVPSDHVEAPQQKKLIVPRKGRSDFCHFDFIVPAAARRYEARIMVSFEKKVLQTMLLGGASRTPGQPVTANANDSKVTLESEFVVRHGFDPLDESTKFGGSIVTDGNVSVLSGDGVNLHAGSSYADIAERIDRCLSLYARSEQTKPASMNGATIEFLRDIAIEGQMLFQHLTDVGVTNTFPDPMDAIQVLSLVDGSRLPLEFVYECSESPNLDATLCESWESCIHARKCRMPDSKEHFCPSRFWGLSRVIERHAYDRVPKEELKSDFRLQPEPTQNRRSLILMQRALIAGSQRVDQHLTPSSGMQAVQSVAAELTGNQAELVDTWPKWRTGVTTLPDSLILIVHTDPAKPGSDIRKLEIGKDDSLHTGQLGASEVGGSATHHPLALLLGCHTGSSTVPFEKLTTQFRRGKAAIVIGSGSLVHVKHAVPFVQLFLQQLHGVLNARPSISFGEFMRRLRVECISHGMLVCLALTAYGDADWLLARSSAP